MGEEAKKEAHKCCANCGIAGIDDVKLRDCSACHLVSYCGVKCQKEHRPKHKRDCKKRAAELRDELLFKMPENSFYGDCPICCLPMPLDRDKIVMQVCCGQQLCHGCNYANNNGEKRSRCVFCRKPVPETEKEANEYLEKRAEGNDPAVLREFGSNFFDEGDYETALIYTNKAAKLGDAMAHHNLSSAYQMGMAGLQRDEKKGRYHWEEAAILGYPTARLGLGYHEYESKRFDRAAKHWIIAAKHGEEEGLQLVKQCYKDGHISKEDFAGTLRAHQAAVDATKSPMRKKAEMFKAATNSLDDYLMKALG